MVKFKELMLTMFLALGVTWMLQYFFAGRNFSTVQEKMTRSGQRFSAPQETEAEINKPLNVEVDFGDLKSSIKTDIVSLETDHAYYEFSNEAASLNRVEFRRNWGGKEGFLTTVFPPSALDREKRCFLVAFNDYTPYYFELIDKRDESDHFVLTYKANFLHGTLVKQFTIFKHMYRIDLQLSIDFQKDFKEVIQPRIFFNSPFVSELAGEDIITGIANDERNNIKVYQKNDETIHSFWVNPTLFGTQDRYFVHAMINDDAKFVQRAYYKAVDLDSMYSILEGPLVKATSSWRLSFFFGPKEDSAMSAVDSRLEQVLNYGWFSFISKPFSKVLLSALNIIYSVVHNYGWAIIILTILLKLLLLPFTWKGEQSLKKTMEYQKKLEYIQSKYKHDKEALNEARTELVRKHGMPGMAGCLPLFLQLPIFWALSIILANSIELYKSPFLWIPDLSAKDPYYILSLLTAIAMILHAPQVNDPKQRISSVAMAFLIAAVVSSLSSGLALFTLVSTLLGVVQAFIARKFN